MGAAALRAQVGEDETQQEHGQNRGQIDGSKKVPAAAVGKAVDGALGDVETASKPRRQQQQSFWFRCTRRPLAALRCCRMSVKVAPVQRPDKLDSIELGDGNRSSPGTAPASPVTGPTAPSSGDDLGGAERQGDEDDASKPEEAVSCLGRLLLVYSGRWLVLCVVASVVVVLLRAFFAEFDFEI